MAGMRIAVGVVALTLVAACGTTGSAAPATAPSSASPAESPVATVAASSSAIPTSSIVPSTGVAAITSSTPAARSVPRLHIADGLGDEGGAGQLIVVEVADPTDTWAQV